MKTELHLHTCEVSRCGHVPAAEAIREYHKKGYGCVTVTDHFSPYFIDRCKFNEVESISEEYLRGYRIAKEEGEKLGITVLLGTEICLYESSNDYLVYGVDEDIFEDDTILKLSVKQLSEFCKERGYLLYQAHPFRNNMKVVRPEYLFGIEVNNGNPRHNSRNNISALWAELHGLRKISGSDYHQKVDLGRGGIITDEDIKCNADLIKALTGNNYSLITV